MKTLEDAKCALVVYFQIYLGRLPEDLSTKWLGPQTSYFIFFPEKQEKKGRVLIFQRYTLMNEMA